MHPGHRRRSHGAARPVWSQTSVALLFPLLMLCAACSDKGPGTPAGPAAPQCSAGQSVNELLKRTIFQSTPMTIEIAPMVKRGDPTPGSFISVGTYDANTDVKLFDAFVRTVGVSPCLTNPGELRGAPGFLEYIPPGSSTVLNPGGSRSIFGFFIRGNVHYPDGDITVEWFALFSYDKIVVDGGTPLCAAEFFLFGSYRRGVDGTPSDPAPPLLLGLAVNSSGCSVSDVPGELADVGNFLGKAQAGAVKAGVGTADQGCLQCHGRDDQVPELTLPFPWVPPPDAGAVCPGAGADGGDFPRPCPVTLGEVPRATTIAAGSDVLYVACTQNGVGMVSLAKDGGTPLTLDPDPIFGLAADDTGGYWFSPWKLVGAPTGGAPTPLYFPPDGGSVSLTSDTGLALDSQYIYFPAILEQLDGGSLWLYDLILRIPKSGGSVQTVLNRPFAVDYGISALAVDDTNVYFAMRSTGLILATNKVGGGPIFPVATGTGPGVNHVVRILQADATSVYFLDTTFHVHKAPKDGGGPTIDITPVGAQTIGSFAIDATTLGVTDRIDGVVLGSDLQGLNPFPFAPPESFPSGIALDATSVYWIIQNPDGGPELIRSTPR